MRGPLRLEGVVRPPGDKSIAHRAVLLAALARGSSDLRGLPDGDDVRRTLDAVAALGVGVERRGIVTRVHGVGLRGLCPARGPIDCGNSGTTMRLLCGVLAAQPFTSLLVGDASLSRRPMRRVAAPLAAMGARVDCLGGAGRPPLRVGGGARRPLVGCEHRLEVDSAQVRAAVLLAGLQAAGPTRIAPAGASRDHLERLLSSCGVHVRADAQGLLLLPTSGAGWSGFDLEIPGDLSSAAFWIALAAATPGARLRVQHVGLNPGRGRCLELLRAGGAHIDAVVRGVVRGEPWGEVQVRGARLSGLRLAGDDTVRCIDEVPALCAAAAAAGCAFELRDAAELRVKESDRIAALVDLLRRFGARARERRDGLDLPSGTALHPARVRSAGDHRIAMTAALLASRAAGTSTVLDVACVRASYPGFAADLCRLARSPALQPGAGRRDPRARGGRSRPPRFQS